jgi:hypothetical protein
MFGMKRNMYIERPRLRSKMERQAKERSWKVHTQTTVCFTGRSRMTGKNDKKKGRWMQLHVMVVQTKKKESRQGHFQKESKKVINHNGVT